MLALSGLLVAAEPARAQDREKQWSGGAGQLLPEVLSPDSTIVPPGAVEILDGRTSRSRRYSLPDGRFLELIEGEVRVDERSRPDLAPIEGGYSVLFEGEPLAWQTIEVGGRPVTLSAPETSEKGYRRRTDQGLLEEVVLHERSVLHALHLENRSQVVWLGDGTVPALTERLFLRTGMRVLHADSGDLQIEHEDGSTFVVVHRPRLYERDDPEEAIDGRFRLVEADGGVTLETWIPAWWLRAPERRYPVVLDPQMTFTPGVSCEVGYTNGSSKWDIFPYVRVGGPSNERRTYLSWNLSSLSAASVASVNQINLILENTLYSDGNTDGSIWCHLYDLPSAPCSTSAPSLFSAAGGGTYFTTMKYTPSLANKSVNWNIVSSTASANLLASLASGWWGMGLALDPADVATDELRFCQTGCSFVPTLIVTYTSAGSSTAFGGLVTDSASGTGLSNAKVQWGGYAVYTNASGIYSFTNLPCQTGTLVVSKSGYQSSTPSSYTPICNASNQKNVSLTKVSTSFAGKVTHAATGQVIANVKVEWGGQTAYTNSSGDYSITNQPCQTSTLKVSKSGYQSHSSSYTPSCNTTNQKNVSLSKNPTSFGGKVTDAATGQVISNAKVEWGGQTTYTNSSGDYSITNQPCQTSTLKVSKSGYQTYSSTYTPFCNTTNQKNVSLTKVSTSFGGKVTDAVTGQVVANAKVEWGGQTMYTNSSGDYSITNQPCQTSTLKVSKSGYKTYSSTYTPYCNTTNQKHVSLTKVSTSFGGKVTDAATGQVIANAKVEWGGQTAYTNPSGDYSITNQPCQTSTLKVSKSGYQTHSSTYTPSCNTTNQKNVSLSKDLTSFGGKVTDAGTGQVIANAKLEWGGQTTYTNPSGDYSITNQSCQTSTLKVSKSGYQTHSSTYTPSCNTTNQKNVSLSKDLTSFVGKVTDAGTGQVIANAKVEWGGTTKYTNAVGDFGFTNETCQTSTLTVSKSGYQTHTSTYTPTCGGSDTKNVSLSSDVTSFGGTVTDAVTGVPISQAYVQWGSHETFTSSLGAYGFADVGCATSPLTVSKDGYVTSAASYTPPCGDTGTQHVALSPDDVDFVEIGGVRVYAANIKAKGGSKYELSGAVTIEKLLDLSGAAIVDTAADTLKASGSLSVKQIDLATGSIDFSADSAELTLHPQPGLNQELSVFGLEVDIETIQVILGVTKAIRISGEIGLPAEFKSAHVDIDNLVWDESYGFAFEGAISVPSLPLAGTKWAAKDLLFLVDTAAASYSGQGTLSIPTPPIDIEGHAKIVQGQLESLGGAAMGVTIPIHPNMAITDLSGKVQGLVLPPVVFTGGIGLESVPPIPAGATSVTLLKLNTDVVLDTSGHFALDGALWAFVPASPVNLGVLGWNYTYEGMDLIEGDASWSKHAGLDASAKLHVLGDLIAGQADLALSPTNVLQGYGLVAVTIPEDVSFFGGIELAKAEVFLDNDGLAVGGYVGPLHVVATIDKSGKISFDKNFLQAASHFVGGGFAAAPPTFAVPQGESTVAFRIDLTSGQLAGVTLNGPDAVFTPSNSPAGMPDLLTTDQVGTWLGKIGAAESYWFVVQNPTPGDWTVTLDGESAEGNVSLLVQNERPTVTVSSASYDPQTGKIAVEYESLDPDDVANVTFHLDRDRRGFNGVREGNGAVEVDGKAVAEFVPTTVPPGKYHVYVAVRDGASLPAAAYAPAPIVVAPPDALPAPPPPVVASGPDGALAVQWNPVPGSAGTVVVFEEERGNGRPARVAVAGESANQVVLTVTPGRAYTVRVHAYESDGRPGLPSAAVTVVSQTTSGNNPPAFEVRPPREVRVGSPLVCSLHAHDLDDDPLTFLLLDGPEGMIVQASSGLLTWVPAPSAGLIETVRVRVSDGQGGTDELQFELHVLSPLAPNAAPVVSTKPPLTAPAGKAYQIDLDAIDPEAQSLAFEKDGGPPGLSVTSNGLVSWTPTIGQAGTHAVSVLARDADGGEGRLDYDLQTGPGLGLVPITLGQKLLGTIDPGGGSAAVFTAIEGTKVWLKTKAAKGDLQPRVRLFDPLDELVATVKAKGGSGNAKIAKQKLLRTGLYRIELTGVGGSSGDFKLLTDAKLPSWVKETIYVTETPVDVLFDSMPGRHLALGKVAAKGKSTLWPQLELIGPDGQPIDLAPYESTKKQGLMKRLDGVPLEQLGTYRLRISAIAETSGKASVKLKFTPFP